jgi:hypothetical protein
MSDLAKPFKYGDVVRLLIDLELLAGILPAGTEIKVDQVRAGYLMCDREPSIGVFRIMVREEWVEMVKPFAPRSEGQQP